MKKKSFITLGLGWLWLFMKAGVEGSVGKTELFFKTKVPENIFKIKVSKYLLKVRVPK